ncbi:unnamed protein product, partial [Allacma fusca]
IPLTDKLGTLKALYSLISIFHLQRLNNSTYELRIHIAFDLTTASSCVAAVDVAAGVDAVLHAVGVAVVFRVLAAVGAVVDVDAGVDAVEPMVPPEPGHAAAAYQVVEAGAVVVVDVVVAVAAAKYSSQLFIRRNLQKSDPFLFQRYSD